MPQTAVAVTARFRADARFGLHGGDPRRGRVRIGDHGAGRRPGALAGSTIASGRVAVPRGARGAPAWGRRARLVPLRPGLPVLLLGRGARGPGLRDGGVGAVLAGDAAARLAAA